jgi:hypothetical protein
MGTGRALGCARRRSALRLATTKHPGVGQRRHRPQPVQLSAELWPLVGTLDAAVQRGCAASLFVTVTFWVRLGGRAEIASAFSLGLGFI